MVKSLPWKHENPSQDSQHSCKKLGAVAFAGAPSGSGQILEACQAFCQALGELQGQ